MKRRTLLRQLAVSATAAVLLPSCLLDQKKVSVALNNLKISNIEEELLALLAETIIPETETPGARSLKAHLFALVMVDDCLSKEDREKYLAGMRSFDKTISSMIGKTFAEASVEERVAVLNELEKNRETLPEELTTFYRRSKRYIVQGYLSSQHFLTNVKKYELVPGPDFRGCVPVSNNPKTNA